MKLSLNRQILMGAVLGVAVGMMVHALGPEHSFSRPVLYGSRLIGQGIFTNLLKMILIPLIFTSVAVGIANLQAHAQMGRVWKLTLAFFLSTPVIASAVGLTAMNLFQPGKGLKVEMFQQALSKPAVEPMSFADFLQSFVAGMFANPVAAMANGEVLPTIIFAIFLGVGLIVAGEQGRVVRSFLNDFFEIIMLIVGWIMRLLPLGLMALLINLTASQDTSLFSALGTYMAVVVGTTLFHGIVVLPGLLYVITGISPKRFFAGMSEALITAFSTSSSSATLPISLRCAERNLGVEPEITRFVMPLGTTVNMDGTALYEAMAALFVANLAGIELNLVQQITVLLMAVVASIGAPGIPSAGLVTMMMVFQSVGLPTEAIAILIPIDRPLDAVRTMVNVEGDAIGSCIVQRFVTGKKLSGSG